ncbi:MAG: beta-lactamase family protein [Xanthomonadales bacterium]|nr:beta-lactamase family protein [Xanthomonadales bacterium]
MPGSAAFRRLACAALLAFVAGLAACAQQPATRSIGEQREDVLFWSQAQRDAGFRHMQAQFPSHMVAHGSRVHPLPAGRPLSLGEAEGGGAWLGRYMAENRIAGLMILEDGQLRLERYGLGFGPAQRWESFSVAKSVTSVLLGIALERGFIASLADPVDRYVPELTGTAYAGVTVHQLLTMTTGVRWNEDYEDPAADVARMYRGACVPGRAHVVTYLSGLPRAHPPGSEWNYNTAETDLLGVVVQRATRRPLATWLSESVWQPYGMAADAFWIKDECDGGDTGGSGLSATLGDYARFGQFMLDGGRINGQPVIAEAWLEGAVRRQTAIGADQRGYGYQWWTDADGSYAAIGIFGQMVFIDPARGLVIAQLASWPRATSAELVAGRRAFVSRVQRTIDAEREDRR